MRNPFSLAFEGRRARAARVRRLEAPSSEQTTKEERTIVPECNEWANFHNVIEITVTDEQSKKVSFQYRDCEEEIKTIEQALQHATDTIEELDLYHLQSLVLDQSDKDLNIALEEASAYVLKFPKYYIVYGYDQRTQQVLRLLTPFMIPELSGRKVIYEQYMAVNLATGLGGCICCYKYRAENVKGKGRYAEKKTTAGNVWKLAVKLNKITTLKKHIKPNKKINLIHKEAVRHYFHLDLEVPEGTGDER